MRRTSLVRACLLAAGLLAVSAAPAFAAIIELGNTMGARGVPLVAPSCPPSVTASNCKIVLAQVTALETVRGTVNYPTAVRKAGYLVAWTIGLSALSSSAKTQKADIHSLDANEGGTTRAGIVVLQPVGPHKLYKWKLVAESPIVHLQPYLGQVVQFPLSTPLPVKSGEVVGLTVPTWAPVLTINVAGKQFAYRQSRNTNCAFAPSSPSTQSIGEILQYGCDYPGTRLEYSATEVTNPVQDRPIPGT